MSSGKGKGSKSGNYGKGGKSKGGGKWDDDQSHFNMERDFTTGVRMTLLKLVPGCASKWPTREGGSFRSIVLVTIPEP